MKRIVLLALWMVHGCAPGETYDIARYYTPEEQDRILTEIVTFIYDAPPQVSMKDRFLPQHHNYYSFVSSRFSILKYFVTDNGIHYFYVMRPSSNPLEKRGVGGHYKMDENFKIREFREEFVTPMLREEDIKGRCGFLFDEMVKGDLAKYLEMESYVQWPNAASVYDTVTYEWRLKSGDEP